MMEENISAISTAPLASGVAIIRISGNSPLSVAEKMFKCKTPVADFEPYKMYVGTIDGGSLKDFGMCVYFKAPKSYTGEDMVEFHCHGGVAISRAILKKTIELGCRLAERGEFTRRAFLNGKMSLSSCEGLIDMINAESESQAKMGFYLYREKLLKKIISIQENLKYVLALIDANIDYPEEDIEFAEYDKIKSSLNDAKNQIISLLNSYNGASKLKTGVNIAICGKPNAGKSSILNAILDCDKAIVTNIEGTTRDVVEGSKIIDDIKFNFYDTAGIRESDNVIEQIGIEKSKKIIDTADIVLLVLDGENGLTETDKELLDTLKDKNLIIVVNKLDNLYGTYENLGDIFVSAKTGENIVKLEKLIVEKANVSAISVDGDFLTEERHYIALQNAVNYLDKALSTIEMYPLDLVSVDIKSAWRELGLISGETCDEAVISEIFAKFCVGK